MEYSREELVREEKIVGRREYILSEMKATRVPLACVSTEFDKLTNDEKEKCLGSRFRHHS
jgi:hypothetical protein